MRVSRKYIVSIPPVIIPPDPEFDYSLNFYEQKASEVYTAYNSIKDGTTNTVASNLDSIKTIKGLKGVRDMPYVGINNPTLYGRKPWLNLTSRRPFIPFKNAPNAWYSVDLYTGGNRQYYYYDQGGYACTFVMQLMPGQSSEAWINDYGARNYMGELNGLLRVNTEEAYRVGTDSMPIDFMYTVLHIEYKRDFIKVWRNGVFVGQVVNNLPEHSGNYGDLGKLRDSIGVATNMANVNFFAMYQWYSPEMTYLQANRDAILSSIGNKWLAGQMETRPYAKNLTTTYNNSDRWIVAFTAMNSTSQQIADTNYQWYLRITNTNPGEGGSFAPQVAVGQNRNYLLRSEIQSYINSGTAIFLNCQVEVGGTGTWTTVASPYNSQGL